MREEDTVCVGSDGLRYCKVCGEAKEAFFPEGGFMGMKKHSRQCACDRKAYEEEQKYFKDKEHRELVPKTNNQYDFFSFHPSYQHNFLPYALPHLTYYGIGEKRLRQIAGENEGADFIFYFFQRKIGRNDQRSS